MYKKITQCRLCGNKHLESIISLGKQCFTGIFPKSGPQNVPSGPLVLAKCGGCDLVQLLHSYNLNQIYGQTYGYRSGLNRSMVGHLKALAAGLLEKYQPKPKDLIIDIGSNDATLLKCYPEDTFRLLGIDPTGTKFKDYYPKSVQLIPDFFSAYMIRNLLGAPKAKAKIITSIAMFYDLEDPIGFAAEVTDLLADDGVWVFEQSYLPAMLEAGAYDTICHEHLEYYAFKQIKHIADEVGLKIIDVEVNSTNGGSLFVVASKKTSSYPECTDKIQKITQEENAKKLSTFEPYHLFNKSIQRHREELLGLIASLKKQGKTIFGYGASTKGNVLLQYCDINSKFIPFIAEVNEDKYGSFTPGSKIPIISEEEAHALKPDYFLVLPWHFKKEIMEKEHSFLSSGGHLVFPFPKLQIFPAQD